MITSAMELAVKITHLLLAFMVEIKIIDNERKVTSGYRPPEVNERTLGAVPNSHHLRCEAADLEDSDGQLAKFCIARADLLEKFALWMENPLYTRTISAGESKKIPLGQQGWVHLQSVPPKSGHRIFIPYAGEPP
jgi:hypothetical protein